MDYTVQSEGDPVSKNMRRHTADLSWIYLTINTGSNTVLHSTFYRQLLSLIMSRTRSLDTINRLYVEEGLAEEQQLLENENNNGGNIIRTPAQIHVTSGTEARSTATFGTTTTTTTTTTTSITTSTTTSATTTGTPTNQTTKREGKLPDKDVPHNDLDDPNSYKRYGLCGSRRCTSHWVCKDPLLYRRSVCDRLSNLF